MTETITDYTWNDDALLSVGGKTPFDLLLSGNRVVILEPGSCRELPVPDYPGTRFSPSPIGEYSGRRDVRVPRQTRESAKSKSQADSPGPTPVINRAYCLSLCIS